MASTLFDKIWRRHLVKDLGDGFGLIFVDRHLLNDMSARGLLTLNNRGLPLKHPELTFGAADHTVATLWNAGRDRSAEQNPYVTNMRANARQHGYKLFDTTDAEFGIIHVVAGEQALALPGTTIACGDSHTCTLGAVGAVAWGLGQSDVIHILATQASVQRKPKTMRVVIDGALRNGVTPKDLILYLIAKMGVAAGAGYAAEFAGEAIRSLPMEARFTICNMAVEFGARYGLIAPDDVTFDYLRGRPYAPAGAAWDAAVADWRTLPSDDGAVFDKEYRFDAADVEPQVSWGINPAQSVSIDGTVPEAGDVESGESAMATYNTAMEYSGLTAGQPIAGVPVDIVFIGSCTNARISDLRAAATIVKGRRVASTVTAWVSPGSELVRRAAEEEGLDKIFKEAGFGWGHSGCSMCAGAGDQMSEIGRPGQRIISTTNRNFVGRQGPGTRTHLASPVMAAAAAIEGKITDFRTLRPQNG